MSLCNSPTLVRFRTTPSPEMNQIFVLAFSFSLLSLSLAQCTGTLTNSSHQVSVSWVAVSGNSVSFTFTAPANSSQYISLAVSDHPIISVFQFVSYTFSNV